MIRVTVLGMGVCFFNAAMHLKNADGTNSSVDPDQTAPGYVLSA